MILEIFLLQILMVNANQRFIGRPQGWKKDMDEDCNDCLVYRKYICENSTVCETGFFEDKIYESAFINHCFGIDQLNQDTIYEFLLLFNSEDEGWREPLRELLGVIQRTGLWTERDLTSMTPCSIQSQQSLQKRSVVDIRQTSSNKTGLQPYISVTQFECPTNRTTIWREQFRYCGPHDKLTTSTKCVCTENIDIRVQTEHCFDDYGYDDRTCETRNYIPCHCSQTFRTETSKFNDHSAASTIVATSIFTMSSDQTSVKILNATTKPIRHTANIFPPKSEENLKLAITILCVCVAVLLICIVVYCVRKLSCRKSDVPKDEWDSLQPTDVSGAHLDTLHHDLELSSNRSDAGNYFSIGKGDWAIYHTIGNIARAGSAMRTNNSSTGPPLPLRLFSVSSMAAEFSLQSSPTTRHSPLASTSQAFTFELATNSEGRDRTYATIGAKQDEQAYEVPITGIVQLNNENVPDKPCDDLMNDQAFIAEAGRDVRVNPLYANSDDEAL